MNIKRILCPIDFSDFNQAANEYASLLAQSSGAKIIYLHCSLPEVPYASHPYIDVDQEEARDRKRLEEITPTVEGVEAEYAIEFGSPAEKIVDFANENDVDLVVMGTHGRTGLRRVFMGSVAEGVVRKAECPVLAVKSNSNVPQTN